MGAKIKIPPNRVENVEITDALMEKIGGEGVSIMVSRKIDTRFTAGNENRRSVTNTMYQVYKDSENKWYFKGLKEQKVFLKSCDITYVSGRPSMYMFFHE